jgi:endonuclease/exonuclease/phosphatase family metal-dependent hydrolase
MDERHLLRIAWWNTGLSPPRRAGHLSDARSRVAREVVRLLIEEDSVDLLALGEVTHADVIHLRNACSATPRLRMVLPLRPAMEPRGIGAIYNADRLSVLARRSLLHTRRGQRLSVAVHVRFATGASDVPLHVFLVHWPSRAKQHQEEQRKALGHELQRKVDALHRGAEAPPPVVIMGDFNDEPFDESVSHALLGSRDRTLARRKKGHLYNPFWRLLGERQTLQDEAGGRLGAGTCWYRSNTSTQWYTYDQILVSSSTLAGDGWTLWEEATQVWQRPPLLSARGRLASDFDHFPVVGMLTHELDTAAPQGE